ncbi:hypothetical protein Ga0100231_003005 [Opitutaceae bacterium TAV4]|nr:hypothetical protein Ga0100231_003005 [Opitutaceae bacterium TAV4]RRK01889.1 hypothetical protein Ga0100230_001135 [Opitutaceae bacterium TAV3]
MLIHRHLFLPPPLLVTLTSLAFANVNASGLNERSDAGAAAWLPPAAASPADSLVPADLARRLPLAQRARIHAIGGGVRGFGILAEYPADTPPREIAIARKTSLPPLSGKEPYTPIALARVFDPAGNLAAIEEFTDQSTPFEVRILKPTTNAAGIWRVSFSGGRAGDIVEIRLPATDTWGVRGEMTLNLIPDATRRPRPEYLWIPPVSKKLLIGIETGKTTGIELQTTNDASNVPPATLARIEPDPAKRTGRLFLPELPATLPGTVTRLIIPPAYAGAIVIEGAPGLLCPTPEAALRLRGGTVESHGVLTAGPLQARARDWMVANAPKIDRNLAATLKFPAPDAIPDDVKQNPRLHSLMFGKYAFANTLANTLKLQNTRLDPTDPFFGTWRTPDQNPALGAPDWRNFWPPFATTNFQPSALAAAITFDSTLNAARHHPDLIRRATLGAFTNLASLQGDDLIREGSLERTRYPMVHSFFIYPTALAQSLNALAPLLAPGGSAPNPDPEAAAIWRAGLIAVGDKLADYQGYESNQWSHMILGHLETYLATGEPRFLGYFERFATAFFDGAFGPNDKFGQHPAGFFLEEYGPDGNYDHLSSFCLTAAWYSYRELPAAKPALVEKIRAGLEKNIRFSSFFWLPDPAPDGGIACPTAFNCRTTSGIAGLGYPGMIMAKADFPLGLARFQLTRPPAPGKGIGAASTFSYIANTDAWALDIIRDGLRRGTTGYDAIGGTWVPHIHKAYSQPARVSAAPIPVNDTGKTWQLPGLLAWNRAGLYGVTFYDVVGATRTLNGFTGGGPDALWTPATGAFLLGTAPGKPQSGPVVRIKNTQPQKSAEALTFSCIYGTDTSGAFFYSGKERTAIDPKAQEEDRRYEIHASLDRPLADLRWRYDLQAPDAITIAVSLKAQSAAREAFVNFPLRTSEATSLRLDSPHSLTITGQGGGSVRLTWPASAPGQLQPSTHKDIQRLVIPLPASGDEVPVTIVTLPAPVAAASAVTATAIR